MNAEKAIGNAYLKLLERATKKDTPLYEGKTSEDLLGECVITMMKRFSGEVDENEVFIAFEKIFLAQCFFSYKKKNSKKNTFIEYIPEYGDNL